MLHLEIKTIDGKTESIKLGRLTRGMIPALIRGIDKATLRWQREIQLELSKGGVAERVPGLRQPRNLTNHLRVVSGALRRSWTIVGAKSVSGGVEGAVRTVVPYARIHEFGGNTGIGGAALIPPRPYIGPALETRKDQMVRDIVGEVMALAR